MMKVTIAVLGLLVVLVGAYFLINRYSYTSPDGEFIPQRGTLVGTYVCLPLRDTTNVTAECAAGLHTDDGTYYAIDFGFLSQGMPQLVDGDRLSASGVITPIETLSTDYWQKYPVVGIFSVTDSLEVFEKPHNTATTTLTNTAWVWEKTTLQDGTIQAAKEGLFVLTFTPDLLYQSTTDCNSLSGTYSVDGEVLSLATPTMTKMFCADSIENEYISSLVLTNSYVIQGNTLLLNLDRDYGVMEFKAQ